MSKGYPLNPNATVDWSSNTILTDDDPERAQTYNPPMQEVIDKIAVLRGKTAARYGLLASMQAVDNAVNGDAFFVVNYGVYHYDSAITEFDSPWIVEAVGMGAGAWVHNALATFLGDSSPHKLKGSIMPGPYCVKRGQAAVTQPISFSLDGLSDWVTVTDSSVSPVPLTSDIIAFSAGDFLEGTAGPFEMVVPPYAQTINLRMRLRQDGSDVFVCGPFNLSAPSNSAGTTFIGALQFVTMPFELQVPVNGGVSVLVEAKGGLLANPGGIALGTWGPPGTRQWLRWKHWRNS